MRLSSNVGFRLVGKLRHEYPVKQPVRRIRNNCRPLLPTPNQDEDGYRLMYALYELDVCGVTGCVRAMDMADIRVIVGRYHEDWFDMRNMIRSPRDEIRRI